MKTALLSILLTALALPSLAQGAEDSPLDRLTRRDELSGWEAVGRVDQGSSGFCTGALIAPDLVLTAAHCLVLPGQTQALDPAKIIFRAGYRDGHSVAERRAIQTVVHPEYLDRTSKYYGSVTTDIGLIRLAEAIPTNLAAPFAIGQQDVGDSVSVVSYAQGRAEALSWQRSCSVHNKWEEHGAAAYTCDVTFGSSGAPVFDTSRRRPMIVSVMSRINTENGRIISYGPMIQSSILEVEEALRVSNGVNTAGGGLASVVQQTKGARFVKPANGARFVRP